MPRQARAVSFKEAVTDTGNAAQQYCKGLRREEEVSLAKGVAVYRYINFITGTHVVAAVAGALCYRGKTAANYWDMDSDIQDCAAGLAGGVLQSVLVTADYGWVQTKGYVSNLKAQTGTGMSFAVGDYIQADPSTTAAGKAKAIKPTTNTKVSKSDLAKILQRNVGYAAAVKSTTTATMGAYVEFE